MFAFVKRPGLMMLAGALITGLVAFAAAACGDDDDGGGGGTGSEQAQKAAVVAALTAFRVEGIHDLDSEAQQASEFAVAWSGQVQRMHRVVVGTEWPAELKQHADAFTAALAAAQDDLTAADLKAFKGDIMDAHAAWHELDGMGYAFVSGETGAGSDYETATATSMQH